MTNIFEEYQISVKYIHDQNNNSFVYVKINETRWSLLKVPSGQFEMFIRRTYHSNRDAVPSGQQIAEMMENVRSKCLFDGEQHKIYVRLAPLANGGIEIDLGDEGNTCVKITAAGWGVSYSPDNLFYRPDSQQPLPYPVAGGNIDMLKGFLNHDSEDDFRLMAGFILGAFRPESTYTHLVLQGEQGCGKTTVTRVIKRLVDNTSGDLRGLPSDPQTLFINTQNAHLLSFDNLSGMNAAQSDNFCRLATGGAFSTRRLYSNGEEFTIEARKPVIVNGIDNIATRSDLVDRCIILTLPRMRGIQTGEAQFWEAFGQQAPAIMGTLMNGLSSALKNCTDIAIPDAITPRTRDFSAWAEAGCRGMGLPENAFLKAYVRNRNSVRVDTAFMDAVIMAVHKFLESHTESTWEGTISELLESLNGYALLPRPRNWPSTPVALSNHLTRVSPVLESIGVEYERAPRSANRRTIVLTKSATFNIESHNDENDGADDHDEVPPVSYLYPQYGSELPF